MVHLDLAQLPSNIAAILSAHGSETPPLQWCIRANLGLKKTLDAMTDQSLLGQDNLTDGAMAAAVRGLLYLWSGCNTEAVQHAETAPVSECLYIQALCHRQTGHGSNAKTVLQQLGQHPIYCGLTTWSLQKLEGGTGALLRFRQLLELCQEWEPYAFIDLYEQARAGQLGEAEAVVRAIQCCEFEMLLAHCYSGATGCTLGPRSDQKKREEEARLEQWKRQMQAKRMARLERPRFEPASAKKVEPAKPPAQSTIAAGPTVAVHCPKCATVTHAAESQRGQKTLCGKCGAEFLIPAKSGSVAAATRIAIACPKCAVRIEIPPNARGHKHVCSKCHTQFLIPINAGTSALPKPMPRPGR